MLQTRQDLFTMFNVHVLLQFLQECNLYNKYNKFNSRTYTHFLSNILINSYTFTFFTLSVILFMSIGLDGKWCPVSRVSRVLLKRNGKRNRTENGKQIERLEGKQNQWISLMQLLKKEHDLKQNDELILNKILNQQYISIVGHH